MSEMEIDKAVPYFEKILDNALNQKCELSNWELDFVVTLCRIGASGKIVKLSESQTKSLMSIYFRYVLLAKCDKMIAASDYKCENCDHGFIEGSKRCPKCDGNGYIKAPKTK